MLTKLLTTAVCCAAFTLSAQNITVIDRFHGEPLDSVSEEYVLSGVKTETYIINEYDRPASGRQSLLNQMINYGLKAFVDKNYFVDDGRIKVLSSALDFDEEGGALVKNAIWINDLPFSELFPGFSDDVLAQAAYLAEINGRKISDSSVTTGDDLGEFSLYGFQSMVYELKESAIDEAVSFVDGYMPSDDAGRSGVDYLPNKEFDLMSSPKYDDDLADLQISPDIDFGSSKRSKSRRGQKNEFPERVVELLEENNRILADYSAMFESLQAQIDEINERDNSDFKQEMTAMREMIAELKENPSSKSAATEYLIFDKNEFDLSQAQKARLNRVIILLAKDGSKKALVTGFADKSGNAEYNAWISKQRAESVKRFLKTMGIAGDRVVVTYLGDTESTVSRPADRRVEVSLID